jgi:hypothetical protein
MRAMRKFTTWLFLCFAAVLLAGCASLPHSVDISRQQIETALARRFPYEARPAGLVSFKVGMPQLQLLPEENRVRLDFPVDASERIARTGGHADLGLSFGLRYQASDATLRADHVRIEQVRLDSMAAAWRGALHLAAELIGENLLEGAVLHQFRPEDVARARGWTPGAIRVTPQGVRIELVPPAS